MKWKKFFLSFGINGILAVICLVFGFISANWRPSTVVYEVAKAYGDTSKEDFLIMLPNIMIVACIIFLVIAAMSLIVGLVYRRKEKEGK